MYYISQLLHVLYITITTCIIHHNYYVYYTSQLLRVLYITITTCTIHHNIWKSHVASRCVFRWCWFLTFVFLVLLTFLSIWAGWSDATWPGIWAGLRYISVMNIDMCHLKIPVNGDSCNDHSPLRVGAMIRALGALEVIGLKSICLTCCCRQLCQDTQ